jgi:hypothetical protein
MNRRRPESNFLWIVLHEGGWFIALNFCTFKLFNKIIKILNIF